MQPWDPMLSHVQAARLALAFVVKTPERSCWIALPPALCNHLYQAAVATPVILRLTCIDSAGSHPRWTGNHLKVDSY